MSKNKIVFQNWIVELGFDPRLKKELNQRSDVTNTLTHKQERVIRAMMDLSINDPRVCAKGCYGHKSIDNIALIGPRKIIDTIEELIDMGYVRREQNLLFKLTDKGRHKANELT